jgi:alpha-glucoside transport system substrate-binding protein
VGRLDQGRRLHRRPPPDRLRPDGKAYAVYFKGNVNALVWYSPQQLKELGIGVPTNWAEFTAAMDKAKAEGVAPLAVGGKDGWPLTQWTDPVILRVAGA